ncbi:MAG: fused signal recognition particle receptor [Actinomycetota bacterium]|jgi:fused signal recognition particle receptor|nr:fused signal recognition particle receptor [Actinomycetota bacterium]
MHLLPELLIGLAFLVVISGAVLLGRRERPAPPPPRAPKGTILAPPRPEKAPAEVAIEVPAEVARPSLRDRLGKSRSFLAQRLADALGGGGGDEQWEDIEAVLIQADLGAPLAARIIEDLRGKARERHTTDPDEIRGLLAEELIGLFDAGSDRALVFSPDHPTVWLVLGVNGSGKTTTIGKLAADLTSRGRSVSMAASDTFRAAADEQLIVWAERSGADVVKHQPGADPGAVAYDAFHHARARGIDVLLVDTAGRLHNKIPLMDELAKIRRVIEKEGHVEEALLVLDATAGQNGLAQARQFAATAGVTGVVLTKLDGTAKGGIALAIEDGLGIPIKLIGTGEGLDDLEPFDPKTFVDALLS